MRSAATPPDEVEAPSAELADQAPPTEDVTLEFTLDPADAAALLRRPGLLRTAPSRPVALLWHDDAEGSLAAQGQLIRRDGALWTLEAIEPRGGDPAGRGPGDWPTLRPPPPLCRAANLAELHPTPPFDVAPCAAFEGKRTELRREPLGVVLLDGAVRGLFADRPVCRVQLHGPAEALADAVEALAGLRLGLPRASLAAEALAAAKGRTAAARHFGAPALDASTGLSDGLAQIVGHLTDALLHWVDAYRHEQRAEPVHQARVAIRRLRSALTLYRRALPCPACDALNLALKRCAEALGQARDWDVFLAETGARVALGIGRDKRIGAMLRAGDRQRDAAYRRLADTLASDEFRRLELAAGLLAALRPWERGMDPEALSGPTLAFAQAALGRRMRTVHKGARRIGAQPVAALHELRKDCKRLRYAAEFFAPAFAQSKHVRPFVRRLSALQEELGLLNDSSVAAELMGQLGRIGRGYAGGVVEGWAAAAAEPARQRSNEAWRRFKSVPSFWTK